MNVHSHCNFFEILPDDALLAIGSWVVATGAVNLAQSLRVNRRLRALWGQAAWLEQLLREQYKDLPAAVRTLEQWALWEVVQEAGLEEEHRIGFDFASLDIAWDDRRNEHDILDSRQRAYRVGRILKRFPNAFARIESHCGTGAPLEIAEQFSVARGRTVIDFLLGAMLVIDWDEDDEEEEIFRLRDLSTAQRRLFLTAWGRQIALAARESPHPHGRLAALGKGWVELYVCHGPDLEMPARPDFYQGQTRIPEHDDRGDAHVDNGGNLVYIPFHMDEEASSDDDSSNNNRPVENMGMIEHSDASNEEE